MWGDYPDRIQPLGWWLLASASLLVLAILAAWLYLRGRAPTDRVWDAVRVVAGGRRYAFMVCVAAVLLPVWTLGGSAINTERVRSPGVYLLQANRPGGGTFEVGPVVFVVSWATGYGGTVLGVFVGGFGTWLGWYTRRHGPAVESSASTSPAGG